MKYIMFLFYCLVLMAPVFAGDVVLDSGFDGGVAVVAGADLETAAEIIKQRPGALVHLLVGRDEDIQKLRGRLFDLGLSGKVTVGTTDGKSAPLIGGFVNLVVDEAGILDKSEVMRILAPNGCALINGKKTVKPRPAEMDVWPQYMYNAAGNAVSKDKLVKPPLYHVQWTGSPRWGRHHDTISSVTACVSSDDKVFYIIDEGMRYSPLLPSHWKLVARDAYNGVILWKRDINEWFPHLQRLKSGPATLPRRLMAIGDKVYVTLGIEDPISVLDAATGETLETLEGSEQTEEMIYEPGTIFAVIDRKEGKRELRQPPVGFGNWIIREKHIVKFDLGANKAAWDKSFEWVAPLTLAAADDKVCFYDGKSVVALHKEDGTEAWKSEELPHMGKPAMFFAPKLVIDKGVVMFAGGENFVKHAGSRGKLTGLSLADGKVLWKAPNPASGYQSPEDLFVIDGVAWAGDINTHRWYQDERDSSGVFMGVDVEKGNVAKEFPPDMDAYWFHHRCHPAKATEDFVITSRTGIEFVDIKQGHWTIHHWIRGACLYGLMPANGMIYAPHHPCACYLASKLYGFTAIKGKDEDHIVFGETGEERLETQHQSLRHDAGQAGKGKLETRNLKLEGQKGKEQKGEWPTYRGDNRRSGAAGKASGFGKEEWAAKLGGELTPPVIAGGKVLVSRKDTDAVFALDADDGKVAWKFHAGAQVDSPPTVYNGCAYFGSADGWIYCLDMKDGSLAWKYRAGPTAARNMYFERLESLFPVHGSVLVRDGKVYAVAGRSMFVDTGLRFVILDAATGRKLGETVMDDKVPETGEPLQMQHEILNMAVALPDILSCDDSKIYMRYQEFDFNGKRTKLDYTRKLFGKVQEQEEESNAPAADIEAQKGNGAHLFSATGFLDDSWWHRTYWLYGKHQGQGWRGYYYAGMSGAPAGRIINFDDKSIYVWGRLKRYFRWSTEYEYFLYATDRDYNQKWGQMVPILVKAMLLAGDKLYICGPEEVVNQKAVKQIITQEEGQKDLMQQETALMGLSGGMCFEVDTATGKILSGYITDTIPVMDGMAGAYGKIFCSMADGTVRCWSDKGQDADAQISSEKIAEYNGRQIPAQQQRKKRKKEKK